MLYKTLISNDNGEFVFIDGDELVPCDRPVLLPFETTMESLIAASEKGGQVERELSNHTLEDADLTIKKSNDDTKGA